MNFLSHYYFDRYEEDPYKVFGAVLPDLVKNANKSWNPHPEKAADLNLSPHGQNILKGWKKHLQIDRIYHNTAFFFFHQHELKLRMRKALQGSAVKPFFLGHIGTELILDHLLLKQFKIDLSMFYGQLSKVEDQEISVFLQANGLTDIERFFTYFDRFKSEKYLANYIQPARISYALKGICSRLWPEPFSKRQEDELTAIIETYISFLEADFMLIFDEIDSELAKSLQINSK